MRKGFIVIYKSQVTHTHTTFKYMLKTTEWTKWTIKVQTINRLHVQPNLSRRSWMSSWPWYTLLSPLGRYRQDDRFKYFRAGAWVISNLWNNNKWYQSSGRHYKHMSNYKGNPYLSEDEVIFVPLRFRERNKSTPAACARYPMAISISSSENGWLAKSSSLRVLLHFWASMCMPFLDATIVLLLKYRPQYRHSSSTQDRANKNKGKAAYYCIPKIHRYDQILLYCKLHQTSSTPCAIHVNYYIHYCLRYINAYSR